MNEENSPTGIENPQNNNRDRKITHLSTHEKRFWVEKNEPNRVGTWKPPKNFSNKTAGISPEPEPSETLNAHPTRQLIWAVRKLKETLGRIDETISLVREESFSNLEDTKKIEVFQVIGSAFDSVLSRFGKFFSGDPEKFKDLKIKVSAGGYESVSYEEKDKVLSIRTDANKKDIEDFLERFILKYEKNGARKVISEKNPEEQEKPKEPEKLKEQPEQPETLEVLPEDSGGPQDSQDLKVLKDAQEHLEKDGQSEWQELERLRGLLAQAETRKKNSSSSLTVLDLDLENLRHQYEESKEKMAHMLKERLIGVSEEPLTKEQERLLNDTLFEEIIKKETESYIEALKESRMNAGGVMSKVQEGMRSFLGQSTVQWYLKQNKYKKIGAIAMLAGIGIGAGAFVGGAAASTALASGVGAAAYRGVRGLASLGTMAGVGKIGKKSIEKIDKEEAEKIENIRNSNKSLKEKSEEFLRVKEEANKERRKVRMAMSTIGVVGGAGAGIATGAALDNLFSVYYGGAGSPTSTLESRDGSQPTEPARISRKGFEPEVQPVRPIFINPIVMDPVMKQAVELHDKMSEMDPETGNVFFDNPELLKHEVQMGDSVWKSLGETVEKSNIFKKLTGVPPAIEAKKTFILSHLINENNLAKNLKVGDELDFSRVFENKEKIEELFKKAESLSEQKIKNILENNNKISTWLEDSNNRGKPLNSDTLKEILNQDVKPKTRSFEMPEVQSVLHNEDIGEAPKIENLSPDPFLGKVMNDIANQDIENKIKASSGDTFTQKEVEVVAEVPDELKAASVVGAATVLGGKVVNIAEYKKSNGFRSLSTDSRKLVAEKVSNDKVEQHLKNDINNIYGKKGILGIGKVEGVDTSEWKEISKQNVLKVINFYKNPEKSDLPKKIIESLSISQQHRNLVEYIDFLRGEARVISPGSDIVPSDNDTVEDYLKQIGKFLMEHPKIEIPNNVSGLSRAA